MTIAALLLAIIAPVGLWFWWWIRLEQQIAGELERIRAAGEPTSVSEVVAQYSFHPPPGDVEWIAAVQRFEGQAGTDPSLRDLPFISQGDRPEPGKPWPSFPKAQQFVQDHAELYAVLMRASAGGFPGAPTIPRTSPGTVPIPDFSVPRASLRLLQLKMWVSVYEGDGRAAAESLKSALRLGQLTRRAPPTQITYLMAIVLDGLASREVAPVLSALELSEPDLAEIQQALRMLLRPHHTESLRHVLFSARAEVLAMYVDSTVASQRIQAHNTVVNAPVLKNFAEAFDIDGIDPHHRAAWEATKPADMLLYLESMRALIDAARKPWPASLDAARDLEASLESRGDPLAFLRGRQLGARRELGSALRLFSPTARCVARVRCAETAVAVERFRIQQNRIPRGLHELVPGFLSEIPIDPFDGKPLRYLAEPEAFAVWSIGVDRVDGGGRVESQGWERDLVARVRLDTRGGGPQGDGRSRTDSQRVRSRDAGGEGDGKGEPIHGVGPQCSLATQE